MSKYLITLSNGTVIEYNESDTVDLIIERQYITPTINKCSEKIKKSDKVCNYYRVRSFDIINIKIIQKKFSINNNSNAEKQANDFLNTLEPYDTNNIDKYVNSMLLSNIYEKQKFYEKHFRYYKKITNYEIQELPIDPYIFGVWLGDGNSVDCGITNIDTEIIESYTKYCTSIGLLMYNDKIKYKGRNIKPYRTNVTNKDIVLNIIKDVDEKMLRKDISSKYNVDTGLIRKYYNIYKNEGMEAIDKIYETNIENVFDLNLKNLSVINNKHIPEIYKKNSKENRLQLLAGFIDTDGNLHSGTSYEITQSLKNVKIFDDIKEIAESLGFTVSRKECIKTCLYQGVKKLCPAIRGCISGDVHIIPVKIERKKITKIKTQRYDLLKFKIEKI